MTRQPFFVSIAAYSSAVISVAGIAFFCVARASYSIYYGHYGISSDVIGGGFQDVLIRETSVFNIALLAIVTAVMLRGGWLLNGSSSRASEVEDAIGRGKVERDVVARSVASSAAVDLAEAKRNLARLEMGERSLVGQLSAAKAADRRVRRIALRWLSVGVA